MSCRSFSCGVLLISMLVSVATPAGAQSSQAGEEIRAARTLARDGDLQGDWNKVLKARERFENLARQPDIAWLANYYLAYSDWRLSSLAYMGAGVPSQKRLLERVLQELELALAGHPDFADAQALRAMVSGIMMGLDQTRVAATVPVLTESWKAALENGAKNPRVQMMRAMSEFFAPPQYGGNREGAMERWKQAIALFEQERPDPLLPDWGHAEAWAWLGGIYLFIDDRPKAVEAFDRCLKLRPDFWWVDRIAMAQARTAATTAPAASLQE